MLRYLLTFLGLQLGLFLLALLPLVRDQVVVPWTAQLARACVLLVAPFDPHAVAHGKVLSDPASGFGVSIEAGCNGVEACIVLAAAVLAYPASWRARLSGLVLGFVAVQGVNVLRVISLFYLGQWSLPAFHFAHTYLWQGLIMLDVLGFWLLWSARCARPVRHAVAPIGPAP